MARGFQSTAKPWVPRAITPASKFLVDAVTGSPVGVQNPNANGEDWVPHIFVTQAEIDDPPQSMIDDLNATYILDEAPYNRWRTNGSTLVGLDSEDFTLVQYNQIFYAPLTVTAPDVVVVTGELRVQAWPTP